MLHDHDRQFTGVGRLARVDRLSLFKVLADNTRYAIYQEVARAGEPLSTTEIARRLALHPNTVRPHLEKMREAGLLEVDATATAASGAPSTAGPWSPQAPSLGLEPAGFRLLAHLLAEVAAEAALDATQLRGGRVGGEHGSGGRVARAAAAAPGGLRAGPDGRAGRPGLRPGARRRARDRWPPSRSPTAPSGSWPTCTPIWSATCTGGSPRASWQAVAASPGVTARVESFASLVDPIPAGWSCRSCRNGPVA